MLAWISLQVVLTYTFFCGHEMRQNKLVQFCLILRELGPELVCRMQKNLLPRCKWSSMVPDACLSDQTALNCQPEVLSCKPWEKTHLNLVKLSKSREFRASEHPKKLEKFDELLLMFGSRALQRHVTSAVLIHQVTLWFQRSGTTSQPLVNKKNTTQCGFCHFMGLQQKSLSTWSPEHASATTYRF